MSRLDDTIVRTVYTRYKPETNNRQKGTATETRARATSTNEIPQW